MNKKNDSNYDWEKTGIAKESFTTDGVVDESIWTRLECQGKKKVLYVLREANGNSSKFGEKGRIVDDGNFWFQNCIKDKKLGNRIFTRIAGMQKEIQGGQEGHTEELLKQVAYMNINKRGGGAKVNWKVLNEYAYKYNKKIRDEICILKPDVIVCCGTYWTLVDIVARNLYRDKKDKPKWDSKAEQNFCLEACIKSERYGECKVKIINMYHPSARISDEKYIDMFKRSYCPIAVSEERKTDEILMEKEEIRTIVDRMNPQSEEYYELCEFLSNIKETCNG